LDLGIAANNKQRDRWDDTYPQMLCWGKIIRGDKKAALGEESRLQQESSLTGIAEKSDLRPP